jgi:hypothetical protein
MLAQLQYIARAVHRPGSEGEFTHPWYHFLLFAAALESVRRVARMGVRWRPRILWFWRAWMLTALPAIFVDVDGALRFGGWCEHIQCGQFRG